MTERFNIHSQLEHLQMKYIGTGHPDITRYEWVVNHHRDSAASYIGHHHMLLMFGIAENESAARIKYQLLQQMVAPCGKEPKGADDEEEEDDDE
mmetsp:Transcript_13481/g.25726  ORF Transcript_13481/g.25726 Transcript_13481/m.25726 type:complete len:94 (+) Transcript_13481:68-349(+)|eukprot:CAMPEP_0170176568 /NCGR_PEP_ID=MMETSP0040_2-20121228/9412_1 /TAXON_ID=641309 /ORGANISM="Lotharella oceanica, Strain CCMP622" /LENGTH=93 /DNA_ID=CAMNT_0010418931 /DNA_START=71 /DNA_END=352 /DNA_ORIENTATION=+